MTDFIYQFPDLTGWVTGYTKTIVGVCLMFVGLFLAIAFAFNIITTVFKTFGKKPIDISKFAKALVLAIGITAYIPIALGVASMSELLIEATKPKLSREQIALSYITETVKSVEEEIAEENMNEEKGYVDNFLDDIKVKWTGATASIKSWFFYSSSSSLTTTLMVIRYLITSMTNVLIQIFYVLGPFALLFSVLPGFEGKFMSWLSTWITMLFVPVVYNVLDGISISYFADILKNGGVLGPLNQMGWLLAMVVVYLLPFWISGKIIGNADAGRFISQTGQLATMAMTSGLSKLASSAGSGAMSVMGSVGNVAQTGKDAMSK